MQLFGYGYPFCEFAVPCTLWLCHLCLFCLCLLL